MRASALEREQNPSDAHLRLDRALVSPLDRFLDCQRWVFPAKHRIEDIISGGISRNVCNVRHEGCHGMHRTRLLPKVRVTSRLGSIRVEEAEDERRKSIIRSRHPRSVLTNW